VYGTDKALVQRYSEGRNRLLLVHTLESDADMSDAAKFRIAVVGAGIAGLATAIALKDHPGIDVQIYERANRLQEIGASIALGMRTLERLGVHEALSDEIAFRNHSGHPMIYR
jgi:salicylate hydroxylase